MENLVLRAGSTSCIFHHTNPEVLLVADAYDGAMICEAVSDFVASAGGVRGESRCERIAFRPRILW